jgi:hypothetical protein
MTGLSITYPFHARGESSTTTTSQTGSFDFGNDLDQLLARLSFNFLNESNIPSRDL